MVCTTVWNQTMMTSECYVRKMTSAALDKEEISPNGRGEIAVSQTSYARGSDSYLEGAGRAPVLVDSRATIGPWVNRKVFR